MREYAMTMSPAAWARRDDTADAYAIWLRTPRWRWLRRRSLWRVVEILTGELDRLMAAAREQS